MPSTVGQIFEAADLEPSGVVPWGVTPPLPSDSTIPRTGIYVVSLSESLDSERPVYSRAPISKEATSTLLAVRPELTVDDRRPTPTELVDRLKSFWIPDEVVLYIGLAGKRKSSPRKGEVAKRVGEYYATRLGARSPHAGGWPIKLLACLPDVFVHFAYCDNEVAAEFSCLRRFREKVSERSLSTLRDRDRAMPFANLEFPRGQAKAHGIKGAKARRS